MINFRFHLVSLVAVFLALALGIGMGATVIDKATVDSLKQRVRTVENNSNAANQHIDALQTQLNQLNDFETATRPYVITNQLSNVGVTIVGVRGVDSGSIGNTKKMIADAGGQVVGALWFPAKDNLNDQKAASQLQADLGATSADPNQLRQALMTLVSAVMAGATSPDALKQIVSDGFLEWEGGTAGNDVTKVPFANTRILMTSGATPAVPNNELAQPLTELLAVQPAKRVVAIESGKDADASAPGVRAVFLDPLRSDNAVKGRISTVDDIESTQGEVAAVLALAQLGAGKVGNYGVAPSAGAPAPAPTS